MLYISYAEIEQISYGAAKPILFLPRGSISPALLTSSGIEDASFLTTSCLGTHTLPAF